MKCDIIIPVWNQLELTKNCLDSLIKNTAYPYRLIIINNASDSPTANYLDNFAKGSPIECVIIKNKENIGFTKAINQGFKLCENDFACVLNNDTILTHNWLSEMVRVAFKEARIGIVNPSSNNLGDKLLPGEGADMHARRLSGQTGNFSLLDSCIGFCMLIKQELFSKVGYFDEIYSPYNFEDTDYCRRAQAAGYICVMAKAAYVFHIEKASQRYAKDSDDIFRRNQKIFYNRWGRPERFAFVISQKDFSVKEAEDRLLGILHPGVFISVFSARDFSQSFNSQMFFNIYKVKLPKLLFLLSVLFKILFKKRKKMFDKIIVDNKIYFGILRSLAGFHRAKLEYYNG